MAAPGVYCPHDRDESGRLQYESGAGVYRGNSVVKRFSLRRLRGSGNNENQPYRSTILNKNNQSQQIVVFVHQFVMLVEEVCTQFFGQVVLNNQAIPAIPCTDFLHDEHVITNAMPHMY